MKKCPFCASDIEEDAIKCIKCSEWINKPSVQREYWTEIDKQRFDYAWCWFDFHGKQRMQLFNFFLIITGIFANAYVSAYDKKAHYISLFICSLGIVQSLGFLAFDIRSRKLTEYAEDILNKIEQDGLFSEQNILDSVNEGNALELVINFKVKEPRG